jgi:hypothetical protein
MVRGGATDSVPGSGKRSFHPDWSDATEDGHYYLLQRGKESRTVFTYPEVIDQIKLEGEWSVIGKTKP